MAAHTPEQQTESIAFLKQMVDLLGLDAEPIADESERGFAVKLRSDEPGRLIGRKGHYLRMLKKKFNRCRWVEVDVDGYQKKSRTRGPKASDEETAQLSGMATDAAKEVRKWGKPKRIGPFRANQRRIIHMALKEEQGLVSESEDCNKPGMKMVVIRLVEH